jgi:hypothetical protein
VIDRSELELFREFKLLPIAAVTDDRSGAATERNRTGLRPPSSL